MCKFGTSPNVPHTRFDATHDPLGALEACQKENVMPARARSGAAAAYRTSTQDQATKNVKRLLGLSIASCGATFVHMVPKKWQQVQKPSCTWPF